MKNKKMLLIAIGSLLLIAVGISISYAYYLATVSQQGENIVKTDCFQLTYEDEGEVTLSNTFPIRDSEANTITPYHFKIKNVCNLPAAYQVNLEVLNNTTLDIQYLNYKLDNGGVTALSTVDSETPTVSGATISKKLITGNLLAGEEKEYDLRVWLKESVTTNDPVQNKTFKSKVVVISTLNKDLIPKNRNAVMSALSQFNANDLKDVIMCDNTGTEDNPKYTNCAIYNTIDAAIAAKDTSTIILTNDITRTSTIDIASTKEITLDLNGKTLSYMPETRERVIINKGNLEINDSGTTGIINTTYQVFSNNGNLIVNGGKFIRNTESGLGGIIGIGSNSQTIVNDGYFWTNKTVPIYAWGSNISVTINGGHFESDGSAAISNSWPNADNTNSNININGGTFISNSSYSVLNQAPEGNNVNINGGTFISNNNFAITNQSSGTINITQTDKPIYITTIAQGWKPAIINDSTGSINITASQANRCTANSSDTTSGLCVYADGDGTTNQSGNTALASGSNCTGDININGGTYYGGYVSIINPGYQGGIMNIKNAKLVSKTTGLTVNRTGTVNICSSIIESAGYDFRANQNTTTINYNNVTFSNGTTTYNSNNSYDAGNRIIQSSTCPIS